MKPRDEPNDIYDQSKPITNDFDPANPISDAKIDEMAKEYFGDEHEYTIIWRVGFGEGFRAAVKKLKLVP